MKLDIIAQIVQILKDAPEVGAIEIPRVLFGAWSSVRVSKADANHVFVGQPPASTAAPATPQAPAASPQAPAPTPPFLELKSPLVGHFYQSTPPGAQPHAQ